MAIFLFPMTIRISNEETPEPTKRATVSLIKVKSCNALLRMLLVCVGIYLPSGLIYKFLILDTYHPQILLP